MHLWLVVCAQGGLTDTSITKNRMVGAVSDIQLWVPGAPDRAPTAAAIMYGNARITENFYTVSNLNILWCE